jgi:hypothetical protein
MITRAIVIYLLFTAIFSESVSMELGDSQAEKMTGLELLYRGKAGGYQIIGGSLLNESGLKKQDFEKFILGKKHGIKKIWLTWMGEEASRNIEFYVQKKWHKLQSSNEVKSESLLSQRVDVTSLFKGSCDVGVRSFSLKKKSSVGGWALIILWSGDDGQVVLYQGLARLKPSESYRLQLKGTADRTYRPKQISIVGGGGLAGNGSLNQFDNVALSAGDDWNGSQGKLWDIDTYDISKKEPLRGQEHCVLVDPLLQWIFPTIISFYQKKKQK